MEEYVYGEIDNIVDVFAVNLESKSAVKLSTQFGSGMTPSEEA
jgi:hypothetical protein